MTDGRRAAVCFSNLYQFAVAKLVAANARKSSSDFFLSPQPYPALNRLMAIFLSGYGCSA